MSKSFVLPPFANDAVGTAFRELLSREQVLSDLSTNLSMTESRIEKMNNHSIKISKELEEMQNEVRWLHFFQLTQ
jgi:chaperonin cofactor prefoldin